MVQRRSSSLLTTTPCSGRIKSIIARTPQLKVVGEAGEGQAALQMVENLRPDMVLLDVSLPDMNGIELIHDIKKVLPEIRILMISMHTKIDYLTSAFQAGARGYVVKDAPSEKILQALVWSPGVNTFWILR